MCPVLFGRKQFAFALVITGAFAAHSMQCVSPTMMWRSGVNPKTGKTVYSCTPPRWWIPIHGEDCDLLVPCGKCFACKFNRRLEWQHRLESELWTNPVASFFTLTYNDSNLPSDTPVSKSDIQKFLKRFRHLKRDYNISLGNFKYFIVIEYGSTTHRPHYHGIFFGVDFLDKVFKPDVVSYSDGHPLYTSKVLEDIWRKGFVTVDNVSPAVFAYVTKYVLKTLEEKDLWFVYSRGIGSDAFYKDGKLTALGRQAFENGKISFGKFEHSYSSAPPRFAYRKLENIDPDLFATVKATRQNFLAQAKLDTRLPSERVSYSILRESQKERKLDNEV